MARLRIQERAALNGTLIKLRNEIEVYFYFDMCSLHCLLYFCFVNFFLILHFLFFSKENEKNSCRKPRILSREKVAPIKFRSTIRWKRDYS
jgi:hypothetical protein